MSSVHASIGELEAGLAEIRRSPAAAGRVELIVRRPREDEREVIATGVIDEREGLLGDCWLTRGSGSTPDGSANPDAQLTLMGSRAARLIAGDHDRWPLAGDQLFVDFDLSNANAPPGTRLEVGGALLEVTAAPHLGCGKFARRFGVDAAKFVNSRTGRSMNLRGVNARVLRGGPVATGDAIRKLV
ncbi:MAG TPA: hypothetical protein VL977_07885 [Solirubrobacteraceae bacterium]|nr:hypothetical protein [Solirubrobacteraceae bacterium]